MKTSTEGGTQAGHSEIHANNKIYEVQTLRQEAREALELFETCDLRNVIHAAKITRLGEAHKQTHKHILPMSTER